MHPRQRLLPGLPAPADDPPRSGPDPADELDASLARLADIHRRMDRLAGGKP